MNDKPNNTTTPKGIPGPVLMWLDIETTGLDHKHDPILEVAWRFTDSNLSPFSMGIDYLVDPTLHVQMAGVETARDLADEYVQNMHDESGLWKALEHRTTHAIEEVDHVAAYAATNAARMFYGGVMLAGSGVAQFDIQVIRAQMPQLAEVLPYRTLDIGHMRRFLKHCTQLAEPPEQEAGEHRALHDVEHFITQARLMRNIVD